MQAVTQQTDRRKFQRYLITGESFAGHYPHLGEIIDISMGGVLFNYVGLAGKTDLKSQFVICGEDGCCLDGLPIEVVSDKVVTNETSFSSIITRQRRVRFKQLTDEQTEVLTYFIENNKICEA